MRKLIAIAICLMALSIRAQENGEEEFGAWYMYFGTNKIAERFSIHTEAQLRFYETTSNYNQLLLRTGLNYHINKNAIATVGYGFINTDPDFEDPIVIFDTFVDVSPSSTIEFDNRVDEHRIFEQFILKNKVWEFLFEHRYRLEQRFITVGDRGDFDFDTRTEHRARYRIQVSLPLTDTFFLNFYDELFINLQDNLFGQNRLYGALGIHLTPNSSVQIGYLRNQFSTAVFDRLQIGVFLNTNLIKK